MITSGGYDVWNITEHTVAVPHHNWDKIFGDVKPSLSDVKPHIDKVLENGQWQSIKVHHKAGGEGLIMRGNVDGHSIWVEGFKDSNGKIYVKNAGVD